MVGVGEGLGRLKGDGIREKGRGNTDGQMTCGNVGDIRGFCYV